MASVILYSINSELGNPRKRRLPCYWRSREILVTISQIVMRVISISRRTDIPAFYLPWLLNRLRVGFCHVLQPFNGRVSRVSLRPEDCRALVFWTRDPAALLPHLSAWRQDGYVWYTQVTLTGYPAALEAASPPVDTVVAAMRHLSACSGPDTVIWRYDPILLGDSLAVDDHIQRFATLARALQGTTQRCITSFADYYAKTRRNLQAQGIRWQEPDLPMQRELLLAMSKIAGAQGMTLHACCESALCGDRVLSAHCIDAELIRRLRPDIPGRIAPGASRAGCGCAASVDIGAYDTCRHGCRYCYATRALALAEARYRDHDPTDTLLWRPPALRGVSLSGI